MARSPRPALGVLLSAAALTAAACGSDSGVSTDRAEAGVGATTIEVPATDSSEPPTSSSQPGSTDPGSAPTTAPGPGPGPAPTIEWQDYSDGIEVGFIDVPADYDDPEGETFRLLLIRRLADDQENKIGSLLINPGGPGFGGTELALNAEFNLGEDLVERFDIVGWDPRGTGFSEPAIDCIDDYDEYFAGYDITPDDATERQRIIDLAEDFTARCEEENGEFQEYVGTNNSARDMDSIRRALGEEQISYFGFSYGSELGATWATLFPATVRAAVLDGASDPGADPFEGSLQQAKGFEATISTYLAACSADTACAFHNGGDAEGAFDALMAQLDETPIPSEPGRPDVTRGVASRAVAEAMYTDTLWEQLSAALAAAQQGDGAGLLALYDSYFQRQSDGTWGNELEAFQTIRCMDQAERVTVAEDDERALRIAEAAPRHSPATTGDYFCTFFPPSIEPRAEITGVGAGPIVVIGTTGDAATPLDSTRAMAAALEDGRLVVVTADRHTGYGVNDCVDDIVHDYLIDLDVPPAESEC